MGPLLLNFLLVILSIGILWKGADALVESSSKLAHRFGISDFVIGFTVVAIGTSAPEFAVTISAALSGQPSISVGNIVGSNIFNLGFILGGTAAVKAIATTPKIVYRDGVFLIGATILLYVLLFGFTLQPVSAGVLTPTNGYIMVGVLLAYISYLLIKKEKPEEEVPAGVGDWKDVLIVIIGIAAVVGGGHLLVQSASTIARSFGISEWVIGVTIVAAGTSAPEFATSLTAVLKKRHGLAIGNLIGSDLFNLLGVLGLAAILTPLSGGNLTVPVNTQSSILALVVFVAFVVLLMRSGWKLSRKEGALLVGINLIRWAYDFGAFNSLLGK
ncbi:MAG: cation:H+ antiporter [bacterium]|jgi:cation:H+ antiporter